MTAIRIQPRRGRSTSPRSSPNWPRSRARRPGCIPAPDRPPRTTAPSAGHCCGPPTSRGRTTRERTCGTRCKHPCHRTTYVSGGEPGQQHRAGGTVIRKDPGQRPHHPSRPRSSSTPTYRSHACSHRNRSPNTPNPMELSKNLQEQLADLNRWEAAGIAWDNTHTIAPEEFYEDHLSIAPGWKGGRLDPLGPDRSHPRTCSTCDTHTVPLLTIASTEWCADNHSWIPHEERGRPHAPPPGHPTGKHHHDRHRKRLRPATPPLPSVPGPPAHRTDPMSNPWNPPRRHLHHGSGE